MQGHKTLNAASIATLQRLRHFQGIFKAADVSGDGSLDEDEFVAAFKGQLNARTTAVKDTTALLCQAYIQSAASQQTQAGWRHACLLHQQHVRL